MAQPPFLTDQIQIEPGSAGTRLISRALDGSIQFQDAIVTGGLTLKQLAGFQNVAGIKLVGTGGAGTQYTSIQSALDDVPVTSGPAEPYVILIGPGVYQETVNIVRDGVYLIGLGGVVLAPVEAVPNGPGAYHTVVIQADLGTIPMYVGLQNITVANHHNTFACVRVVGGAASQVAEGGVTLLDVNLEATAPGGNRQIWATSVNNIAVRGGSFSGSNAISTILVTDCARFSLDGVLDVSAVQLDYNSGGSPPSLFGSQYQVVGCDGLAVNTSLSPPISSTLTGAGSLAVSNCGQANHVTFAGNRTMTVTGTKLGNLTLTGTATARLVGSSYGTLSAAAGTTLDVSSRRGTAAFVAAATQAVTFSGAQSNTDYTVALEVDTQPVGDETPWVTAKTTTGFTVNFFSAQTLGVTWTLLR